MEKGRIVGVILLMTLIVLVAVGLWRQARIRATSLIAVVRHPQRVMGTNCSLVAVVQYADKPRAQQALLDAEIALRTAEARMSSWLANSEISRFNQAKAGVEISLSPRTLEVLEASRQATEETGGAFDVTCRPLIKLWERVGSRGKLPTEQELATARAVCGWKLFELTEHGAVKKVDEASVNLGGIAKGYAIDQAIGVLQKADYSGGMVDVGGDLRCFGRPPIGRAWKVDVKNPFGEGRLVHLHLRKGAVCTSGNYARFVLLDDRRYSHILDPATGYPAEAAPSVTIAAPTARAADIWATALSVLGLDGLARLPRGVEAFLVLGDEDHYRFLCTPGFRDLMATPLPKPLEVVSPHSAGSRMENVLP